MGICHMSPPQLDYRKKLMLIQRVNVPYGFYHKKLFFYLSICYKLEKCHLFQKIYLPIDTFIVTFFKGL